MAISGLARKIKTREARNTKRRKRQRPLPRTRVLVTVDRKAALLAAAPRAVELTACVKARAAIERQIH